MSISSFETIAAIYEKSSDITITRHKIVHPVLGKFCVSLNGFYSNLDDLSIQPYWQKFLIPLKRLQFGLCATPFPQNYRFKRISIISSEQRHHLRFCSKIYPNFANDAFAILDLLTDLLDCYTDPLLDKLVELTHTEQKVAWVIKESRLIHHTEEIIGKLNLAGTNILHPLQLKGLTCYDRLVFIGPSRWFPESAFTAPRASQIDILIFDWIKDRWKPQNVFVNTHKSSGPSNKNYITVEERETGSRWDGIDPESLLVIVDKTASLASALNNDTNQDEYENVDAICIFLEDDWALFIEGNEGASTLVIDPDEDRDSRIARIPVKEMKPGMFILVRTGGGGDYIIPVADKIMGPQALKAREYQKRWKELLRNYVRKNGLLQTSIDLLDLGSDLANETNVQNWMSPRSIRTQHYNDFLAIMKLVGLEDQAREYWDMMKRINRAHHKAGFEIRRLLLEQVEDLDMETLQKQGKMDFRFSSDAEGTLTAFRIESLLLKSIEVPYSRIGKPFKLEDQLWHE